MDAVSYLYKTSEDPETLVFLILHDNFLLYHSPVNDSFTVESIPLCSYPTFSLLTPLVMDI